MAYAPETLDASSARCVSHIPPKKPELDEFEAALHPHRRLALVSVTQNSRSPDTAKRYAHIVTQRISDDSLPLGHAQLEKRA